jgi:hypothetical protein
VKEGEGDERDEERRVEGKEEEFEKEDGNEEKVDDDVEEVEREDELVREEEKKEEGGGISVPNSRSLSPSWCSNNSTVHFLSASPNFTANNGEFRLVPLTSICKHFVLLKFTVNLNSRSFERRRLRDSSPS